MSSPPQETETHDVELSREERWVVHDVLVTRADETLEDRDAPPAWLLESLERIEAGDETFTAYQTSKLHDVLVAYTNAAETPQRDVPVAHAVVDRLADLDD